MSRNTFVDAVSNPYLSIIYGNSRAHESSRILFFLAVSWARRRRGRRFHVGGRGQICTIYRNRLASAHICVLIKCVGVARSYLAF